MNNANIYCNVCDAIASLSHHFSTRKRIILNHEVCLKVFMPLQFAFSYDRNLFIIECKYFSCRTSYVLNRCQTYSADKLCCQEQHWGLLAAKRSLLMTESRTLRRNFSFLSRCKYKIHLKWLWQPLHSCSLTTNSFDKVCSPTNSQ